MKDLTPFIQTWRYGLHRALTRHSILYRVADQCRGPQTFTYRIALADPADLARVLTLSEQFALVMSVRSVRVARVRGYVDVEIALPRALHRALPAKRLPRRGGTWVALGQTTTGTPVHVDLAGNRSCHALVCGQTGSGKTVTEQLITWTLAQDNDPNAVCLILIDGKGGSSWWGFDHAAHLAHPVISEPHEAMAALGWCLAELDRRKADRRRTPRVFIVIDEIRELLDLAGDPVTQAVQRITSLGRDLGIHLIAATQHPLVDAVGGSFAKANFVLRLTGAVVNAQAAYVATGVRNSGAEQLQGNGDFLLSAAGQLHRLQVGLVGNYEFGLLPRAEHTPRLDLDNLDLDRVLDVTPISPRADDLEPDHVAVALASNRGINWLQGELGIGGTKATRVREFALAIRAKLHELGYGIQPLPQSV